MVSRSRPNGKMSIWTGRPGLPSENVKGTRGKKQNHHVFLTPFTLHFFQELKNPHGRLSLVFSQKQDDQHVDLKVVSKQMGDRQARFKNRKALS